MKYYKFLRENGRSPYADYQWPLPTESEPGDWVEVEGKLVLCENGIHACRAGDLINWLGHSLYELEYAEEPEGSDNKVFGRKARLIRRVGAWNERTARLYAADCAEHVAHLWQSSEGVTWKPADTIAVVRQCANGNATSEELAAAGDAAWAVVDAAGAARAAARAAAGAAETEWQLARLLEVLRIEAEE